jgi:methionyl-tRNA formyltransferase
LFSEFVRRIIWQHARPGHYSVKPKARTHLNYQTDGAGIVIMNVLFLGSSGPLSLIPLNFLFKSRHHLCAIGYETGAVVSFVDFKYPVIAGQNETVEMFAGMKGIPSIKLFDANDDYITVIKECNPEIIIVSCLAKKLPTEVLSIPSLGCFNLHPSLLPAFRGPVPLFWQFRKGIENFGISLHRMTSDFDSGPLVAQKILAMPNGITNYKASELLAVEGVFLLEHYLEEILSGKYVETIQSESEASYQSYPEDSDFTVSVSWTAKRLYNFICATAHWDKACPCEFDKQIYPLIEAVSYGDNRQFSIKGKIITLPCSEGAVTVRLA